MEIIPKENIEGFATLTQNNINGTPYTKDDYFDISCLPKEQIDLMIKTQSENNGVKSSEQKFVPRSMYGTSGTCYISYSEYKTWFTKNG